jgi:hypothetical protein
MLVDPICPHCGATLPPRGDAAVYQCTYCQRTFEIDARPVGEPVPLAERTTSPDFPRLCEEAERRIVEVERSHAAVAQQAAGMGALAGTLQQAATKKLHARIETTRKAIAERDEATLRECIEKLTLLDQVARGGFGAT